jgi:hypothetical protein
LVEALMDSALKGVDGVRTCGMMFDMK